MKAVIQKGSRDTGTDRKINILRQITSHVCHHQRIQFRHDDTNEITSLVNERTATIACLNWAGDLYKSPVIVRSGRSANRARRNSEICC